MNEYRPYNAYLKRRVDMQTSIEEGDRHKRELRDKERICRRIDDIGPEITMSKC